MFALHSEMKGTALPIGSQVKRTCFDWLMELKAIKPFRYAGIKRDF